MSSVSGHDAVDSKLVNVICSRGRPRILDPFVPGPYLSNNRKRQMLHEIGNGQQKTDELKRVHFPSLKVRSMQGAVRTWSFPHCQATT